LPHLEGVTRHLKSLDPVPLHSLGLAISLANRCVYCVDIHEAALYAGGHGGAARAVRSGRGIDHEFTEAALAFQYFSRICNVFVKRAALPFTGTPFRSLYLNALSAFAKTVSPGPPAPSPIVDLCREADALGTRVLPLSVRIRVQTHIQAWSGEDMGPNRSWVENYLADFSPGDRAIGRLALLSALASHQVDSVVIGSVQPATSRNLLAIVAWSSAQVVLHMRYGALTECVH
jgi:AhpD family alkylhydroperoxidase